MGLGCQGGHPLSKLGWIRTLQTLLRSSFVRYLYFLWRDFDVPFISFRTLNAICSPDIELTNTHLRCVTCECCFTFLCWYLIFSWRTFFALRLLAKRSNLVLSSPKCVLSLLPTNQSQKSSKSLLSYFSIWSTSLCWYKMYESFTFKSKVDLTACDISFSQIKTKGDLKATLWYPSINIASLLSILIKKILSER